jgi:ribosomal protein S27AE
VSLNLYFNDLCPKCHQPTMQAVIEPHPADRNLAVQKYYCGKCGPVKTKLISLKPVEPRPARSLARVNS